MDRRAAAMAGIFQRQHDAQFLAERQGRLQPADDDVGVADLARIGDQHRALAGGREADAPRQHGLRRLSRLAQIHMGRNRAHGEAGCRGPRCQRFCGAFGEGGFGEIGIAFDEGRLDEVEPGRPDLLEGDSHFIAVEQDGRYRQAGHIRSPHYSGRN